MNVRDEISRLNAREKNVNDTIPHIAFSKQPNAETSRLGSFGVSELISAAQGRSEASGAEQANK